LYETSRAMFLRPDLVNPTYTTLPPFAANNPVELLRVSKVPNWPGYIGSPRLATASYGAQLQLYRSARDIALAIAILDPRYCFSDCYLRRPGRKRNSSVRYFYAE
jgi:creatinine amidohydrolase